MDSLDHAAVCRDRGIARRALWRTPIATTVALLDADAVGMDIAPTQPDQLACRCCRNWRKRFPKRSLGSVEVAMDR